MAVIVALPLPTAVASPVVVPIVAICVLLELQATWLVRFTVAPDEVVPMARNWVVCVGDATACEVGIIATDAIVPPAVPPPLEPVAVRVALEVTWPLNESVLAVIVVVPAPTAVATPAALIVATAGTLEVHVTELVMFCVVGCFALPNVPIAVNCAVCPTARDWLVGVT